MGRVTVDLVKRLVEENKQQRQNLEELKHATHWKQLNEVLPELQGWLKHGWHSSGLTAEELSCLDLETRKLALICEVLTEHTSLKVKEASAVFKNLADELRQADWNALHRARDLVSQICTEISASDVEVALTNGAWHFEYEPHSVHANSPTTLRVRLDDAQLDVSKARSAIVCAWSFGPKVGPETGWELAHYFRTPEEGTTTMTFCNHHGEVIPLKDTSKRLAVQVQTASSRFSDKARAELWRLAGLVGIATMGLVAGAHEQFMKLDVFFGLIAVFTLGFSANAVKELFAKGTK